MARTPRQVLLKKLEEARETVKKGDKYMHSKSKGKYIVENLVIREDNDEVRVIYKELDHKPAIIWDRSYDGKDGWIVKTEIDRKKVDRFKKIS